MDANAIRLLAIDDSPDNLTVLKAVLEDALPGCTLSTALDGPAGLAIARAEDPDAILLDVFMPDMDGYEVCRRLKAVEGVRDIPVIFVTALRTDRESRVKALEVGAEAFLSKPLDEQELVAQVRAMAKLKEANRYKRLGREELAALVAERTAELNALARRAEQNEQRHRAILHTAMDGFWWVDMQGRVLEVNETYCRMSGYGAAELLTMSVADLEAKEAASEIAARIQGIAADGEARFETQQRRKDGSLFDVEVCAQHWPSDGGRIVAFMRDITQRKKLQANLAQGDRLASMGMLAGGVAHEINNPLSYVLSNIDALAQDLPKVLGVTKRSCEALRSHVGEEAFAQVAGDGAALITPAALDDFVECAESALEGIRRIRDISRRLGTFARVEMVELERIDLRVAIENAATIAHNELKYRATLVKELAHVPTVMASEGKLSQVFLNLLLNAAHAVGEGDAHTNRITIRTWSEGSDVFAEVADTGDGIPAENLERIFEPFFSTKKVGMGSGLGLPICRTILTELGGDLRVESEVGKGTRFVVRLPASAAEPETQAAAASSLKPSAPKVRGRVLVVDDEEAIRRGLQRLLGREHDVVPAASGAEARALIEKDRAFDVILCDLMMPEVSGMQLHAWLRELDPPLAERVVFMSGGAFLPGAADYVAAAGNLRVDKPFDVKQLLQIVSERVGLVRR